MTADRPWQDRALIFVGGMHRSGTTLVAALLGQSDDASNLHGTDVRMDEGQWLQDVYPTGRALGGMTRWGFAPGAHLDERDASAVPDAAARLWQAWSPYWDLQRHHLVEKTPLNITRTRFLQAVFPQAKFVIVTRHPLTQALALQKWSRAKAARFGWGFPRFIEHWLQVHETFAADSGAVSALHVVRYEHLVTRPADELAALERFVELPLGAAPEIDPDRARSYVRDWERLRDGDRARAWRALLRPATMRVRRERIAATQRAVESLLMPHYAREIERRYGERVRAAGYLLDQPAEALPWTAPARGAKSALDGRDS